MSEEAPKQQFKRIPRPDHYPYPSGNGLGAYSPVQSSRQPSGPQLSMAVAYVLAVFLNGFGAQWFYLRKKKIGFIALGLFLISLPLQAIYWSNFQTSLAAGVIPQTSWVNFAMMPIGAVQIGLLIYSLVKIPSIVNENNNG